MDARSTAAERRSSTLRACRFLDQCCCSGTVMANQMPRSWDADRPPARPIGITKIAPGRGGEYPPHLSRVAWGEVDRAKRGMVRGPSSASSEPDLYRLRLVKSPLTPTLLHRHAGAREKGSMQNIQSPSAHVPALWRAPSPSAENRPPGVWRQGGRPQLGLAVTFPVCGRVA